MKSSQILEEAKANMIGRKWTSPYICDNLNYVAVDHGMCVEHIREYIAELLGGRFSLREWLADNGYIQRVDNPMHNFDYKPYDKEKLQATRMAWIDDLIEHYKAKGD